VDDAVGALGEFDANLPGVPVEAEREPHGAVEVFSDRGPKPNRAASRSEKGPRGVIVKVDVMPAS
jgi:hypothetical protein